MNPMRVIAFSVAILLAPLSARAARVDAGLPALAGDVVDDARVLSPAAQQTLNAELAQLHRTSGHSLVVVTIASLHGQDIAAYGIKLFRAWKLGRKDLNDGVILLIAPNDHRDRIEVGYGLEPVLTDAQSSLILRDTVRPYLKAGDYDNAALAGERAIAAVIGAPASAAEAPAPKPSHSPALWLLVVVGLVLMIVVLMLLTIVIAVARRARKATGGGGPRSDDTTSWSGGGFDSGGGSGDSGGSSDSGSSSTGGDAGGGGASDGW